MIFFARLYHFKTRNKGFSLMELIVAVGVFSLVAMAAVGIMIKVFQAQEKAVAIKSVLDDARFALELITRELRTSTNVKFTTSFPLNCPRNGLQFTSYNQGSAQERFYYMKDTDSDGVADAIIRIAMPTAGSINCATPAPALFTSQSTIVDQMRVRLVGRNIGPNDGQPRITIGFRMHARDPRFSATDTAINVQTTVSQRFRDCGAFC